MTADKTIRRGAALFAAVAIAAGAAAQAQPSNESPPRSPSSFYDIVAPPPLTPSDMTNYCVYLNRVYSLGAGLCIGRTPYVCFPSPGPSTGNRAYWASREDQNFLRPVCY
jgi:hypothetical protein